VAVHHSDEQRLALFIDFENIAIGVRDAHYRRFDVDLVLERLLEKGKLLVKKAYADWSRYSDAKRSFHEAAIELIEVPQKSVGGKNSADIRLVVDAMDLSFQKEHINCFVVASGDSDFSPLVSKLKENNKYVIGLGVKNSTSDLLIENCDEFIFYEDLVRGQQRPSMPVIANVSEKVQEAFGLLVDSILALQRENKEVLWGSMVKETMKRKKPQFNETYFGFRTFSHMLEDAQRRGLVVLRRDNKSGSYIVEDLGSGGRADAPQGAAATALAPPRPEGGRQEARESRREERRDEKPREERPKDEKAAEAAPEAPAEGGDKPAEASEGGNGRRRGRRGRGRRGRGAGAVVQEGMTSEGAEEGADDEASDLDEGPDAPVEEGREALPEPSPAPEAPAVPAAEPEPVVVASPEPAAPSEEKPHVPGEHAGERSGFSFFGWLRREPENKE
jgi:uncharacterized protein (TIGR00288 family)